MNYLVVGLGNFGDQYKFTRHNIGFMVIDYLASLYNVSFNNAKYAQEGVYCSNNQQVYFIKPTTYMNNSGKAVNYYMQRIKVPLERILIIVDDLDFDFGVCKIKLQGRSGGHNGLLSIENHLKTIKYQRLRIGIGRNYYNGEQVSYVLSDFNYEEKKNLGDVVKKASEIVKYILTNGIIAAMNNFNKRNCR